MNETGLELSKPLHERVYERIRDSIGDLMTDEDLKVLVNKAAEKAFFEPVKSSNPYGSSQTTDPVLVAEIRKLLSPTFQSVMKDWMSEHKAEIETAIRDELGKGMASIISGYFARMIEPELALIEGKVIERIQRGY